MNTIKQEIQNLFPELVTIRRTLHEHPELGTQEFETGRIIRTYLNQWGITHTAIADTGIMAILNGKATESENVVALRADMDALPIEESVEHKCHSLTPGMMHACGHDAHTTILLGTAFLLKQHINEWSGTVKLFFQPAEETIGGAKRMITEGCMLNPTVDYVAGLHVTPQYKTGHIEVKHGKLNASSDHITIDVLGKSSHGAYPDAGIDAIVIASNLVLSLQTLVSRNISPLNSAVLTFGVIEGGKAGNIICDHVKLTGILRTLDAKTRKYAQTIIEQQATSIAKAYGGEASVTIDPSYDALINSDELIDLLVEKASVVLGPEQIHWKPFPSLGVEDFSYFREHAKASVFYNLGCTPPCQEEYHALHTNNFDIDENCLMTGVELQYILALELLQKE